MALRRVCRASMRWIIWSVYNWEARTRLRNLWPEAAQPRPGFHEKNQVENFLHDEVCAGRMTLRAAQIGIATNWLQYYKQIPADERSGDEDSF